MGVQKHRHRSRLGALRRTAIIACASVLVFACSIAVGVRAATVPVGSPRTVLYVGDSQCFFLGVGGYYNRLADSLAQLLNADVHVDFDCQSFRRFGPCYGQEAPDCEGVGTAEKMAEEWCTRQPNAVNYTDVVMMIGVNNLKNAIWKEDPAQNEYMDNMTGPETVVRDLGRAADKMQLCTGADLYLAGPLNVQDCGRPMMFNSCEDDITGGPGGKYWRSNWLQQQLSDKSDALGQQSTYVNTSGIEHPELFKDIFHTEHPKDVEAVVNAMVQAFASRYSPPIPFVPGTRKGTVAVINYDDDCEKDWQKRGNTWCGIKNGIVDKRNRDRDRISASPSSEGRDKAYDKKVIGVVVCAVGITILLMTWAVYEQSRRKKAKGADRELLVEVQTMKPSTV